ncbi:MAG: hypothetical protein ABI551_18185 [Polyangiaceae bacterium]
MKKSFALSLLLVAACSKPASSSSSSSSGLTPVPSASTSPAAGPSVGAIEEADSGSAASPAKWTTCEIPKGLVQLGTVKERASFVGDVLVSDKSGYDPATLKPVKVPKKPGDADAATPSGKYADVKGAHGVVVNPAEQGATVENTKTHASVLKITQNCAAGGAMEFVLSRTGRFLICASSREGQTLWDLSAAKPDPKKPVVVDKNDTSDPGLMLAPNDAYGVLVPVIAFGTALITRPAIAFTKLDGKPSKPLTPATLSTDQTTTPNEPFTVAFCGDGAIFATAGDKELGVYKGADGSKITSAPSLRGGTVSFSASGHYLSQTRGTATTVYRLE